MRIDLTQLKNGETPYSPFPMGKFEICPKCGRRGDIISTIKGDSWFALHIVETSDTPDGFPIDEIDECQWGQEYEWRKKWQDRLARGEFVGMTDKQLAEKYAKEFLAL